MDFCKFCLILFVLLRVWNPLDFQGPSRTSIKQFEKTSKYDENLTEERFNDRLVPLGCEHSLDSFLKILMAPLVF